MFRFTFLSLCLWNLCAGFAPRSSTIQSRTTTTTFVTQIASTIGATDYMDDDDLRFRQMISKARECAFSDAGSAVDARKFLSEILHLESGCVSGNLSGDICDNVDEVADIVSHLRVKAENGSPIAVAAAPGIALGLTSTTVLVMLVAVLVSTIDFGKGSTPYTFDEWMWAAQGGYLGSMVEHFLRNGGL